MTGWALGMLVLLVVGLVTFCLTTTYTPGDPQRGYLALTGGTVLAGEELRPLPGATVLVKDGRIVDVGTGVAVPVGAERIDVRGRTVLPGLVDLHIHLTSPELDRGEQVGPARIPGLILDDVRGFPDARRAFLRHGVTAVRSLGDDHARVMDLRRQLRENEIEGPRLFTSGPLFTTPGGHPVVTIGVAPTSGTVRLPATPDEARRMVADLAASKVDLIKVVQERGTPRRALQPIAPPVLAAVVGEAHRHGLPVTAHWGTPDDLREALAAGVDGLEHVELRGADDGWPPEALATMVARRIPLTPTLAVTAAALPEETHRTLRQRTKEFHDAGGRVVLGTDAGMPGVPFGASVHRELALLVDAGLTPGEALRAATSEAAKVLRTTELGSVEKGRAADLLVVKGDPLADVRAASRPSLVLHDGREVWKDS